MEKLEPELEKQFSKEVRLLREFYFSKVNLKLKNEGDDEDESRNVNQK